MLRKGRVKREKRKRTWSGLSWVCRYWKFGQVLIKDDALVGLLWWSGGWDATLPMQGSFPSQGTRCHMLQLRVCSQINKIKKKKWCLEISLAIQWLRLCLSSTRGSVSIPGHGTKIPHAARCGLGNKEKNKYQCLINKKKKRWCLRW